MAIDYSEIQMVQDIVDDLTAELKPTDDQFNAVLLSSKVIGAYRDVRTARCYPKYYAESDVEEDMERFYSIVRSVALYDYNTVGIEFQTANKENQVSREFVQRDSLFGGVIPLSHA